LQQAGRRVVTLLCARRRYNIREAELRTLRLEVERLGGAVSTAEDDARRRADALRERLAAQQAQLDETQAHLETTQARLHRSVPRTSPRDRPFRCVLGRSCLAPIICDSRCS